MAEDTFLTDQLLRQLMDVGEVDLLVGIASHDGASTNAHTIRAIEQCFRQHFPRQRAVIIDACSQISHPDQPVTDSSNAPEKVEFRPVLSSLRTAHHVTLDILDSRSRGTPHRTILAAADLLRARACAVVAPSAAGLAPDRIANLLRPAYREKFDFVAPLYTRHRFHGLLARILLYPMSRAIFGFKIRELYSDECGFSGRLASACANQEFWREESVRARPEAWMAISAMLPDFRRCQSFLGEKIQPPAGSGPDIIEVFRQTVGNLFWCIESYQSNWLDSEMSSPVETLGSEPEIISDPLDLDLHGIFEKFRSGVTELEPVLSSILDPETHAEIKNVVSLDESNFRFSPELWVRAVYDFAVAYHHAVIHRDHLVQALAPLYRGMTCSFLIAHADSSPDEIETMTEDICLEFERQKAYLTEKWKAKVEVKS